MIGTNPNLGWKKAAIGNRQCVAVVYIWITFKMKSRAITVGKKKSGWKKTQCWKSCKLQKKKKKKGGASWSFIFPTQWSQGCRCRTQSHGDGKVSSVHLPRMALPLSAETKRQLARLTLPSIELIAWLETSLGIKKKKMGKKLCFCRSVCCWESETQNAGTMWPREPFSNQRPNTFVNSPIWTHEVAVVVLVTVGRRWLQSQQSKFAQSWPWVKPVYLQTLDKNK